MSDANKTGDGVSRGVNGYSANRGTGSRDPTTVTTVKRMPPKARSDPDEEDSSSEDDDPAIAAMKENIMRYVARSPPARPAYTRPKGTPTGTKLGSVPQSDKNTTTAEPSEKPAGSRKG